MWIGICHNFFPCVYVGLHLELERVCGFIIVTISLVWKFDDVELSSCFLCGIVC